MNKHKTRALRRQLETTKRWWEDIGPLDEYGPGYCIHPLPSITAQLGRIPVEPVITLTAPKPIILRRR